MLKAENLVKVYERQTVLQQVSSQVQAGECLGILGPNGSGKSTFLKICAGAVNPDQGSVWISGQSIGDMKPKERARRIAVLPQRGLPPFPISVKEYLLMGREPYQTWWPWYQKSDYQKVEEWIHKLQLQEDQAKTLDQLSGGERQRVAIGQAMIQEPEYLLLDEPLNHLDLKYQYTLFRLLDQLKKEKNLVIVIVLHDINLAAQYCDQLLFLKEGRVMGYGKPHEVIHPELIEKVFEVKPVIVHSPEFSVPQILFSDFKKDDD